MSFHPAPYIPSAPQSADGRSMRNMKRYNHLFDKIISFGNLLLAAKKAQKGKRYKEKTALFNLNLERELIFLQAELSDMSYRHGGYRDFYIYDPKRRLISAAPYRDRVLHHALCNVIEPLFDRTFIHDSYACRVGKGAHAAVDKYTEFSRKNRFVLQCDIKKYFPSIDRGLLIGIIARKIKCEKTLWLIREIIGSRRTNSAMTDNSDEEIAKSLYGSKGIPIGNLTSQFFANVYMNAFDHFIKEDIGCRYYIRYVGDFVILDNSKERLHEVKDLTEDYLSTLGLCLHERECRV